MLYVKFKALNYKAFMMQEIIVTKRGSERVRALGHLWIYRSDLADTQQAAGGHVVSVLDERKRFVGQALFH
jgi:hypothetical protein